MSSGTVLRLKRETATELFFAHAPLPAAIAGLVSGGLLYWLAQKEPPPPWWVFAGLSLLTLFCLLGALWRFDFVIDLPARCYRMRKGIWPFVSRRHGSLDELSAVALDREWQRRRSLRRGSSEPLMWLVSLELGSDPGEIPVFSSRREEAARRRFEQLSRKLGVAAIDRTGAIEEVRQPGELDRPLRHDASPEVVSPAVPERPPAASGIDVTAGPTGRVLKLPPSGFSVAFLLLLLFGLGFAGFALTALGAGLGLLPFKVTGSRAALVVLATLFSALGLTIVAAAIVGAFGRERIEDAGDALLFSYHFASRQLGVKRVPKHRIEEIAIRSSTVSSRAEGKEIFVRSDERVVVLGRDLGEPELEWLRDLLVSTAAR